MPDEDQTPTTEAQPPGIEDQPRTEGQDSSAELEPAAGPQEGKASGLLRDAIQKVMQEIEHHEQEAQKHLHQAQALRKELRESLAFLRAEGNKAPPTGPSGEAAPQSTSSTAEKTTAAPKGLRAAGRKQAVRKKGRGG